MTQYMPCARRAWRSKFRGLVATLGALALSACAGLGEVPPAPQVLDVGVVADGPAPVALPPRVPIAVPAVEAAPLLMSQGVVWREKGSLEPQAYATYQWASPPAELVSQRLRERLALEGPVTAGNSGGMPELRVTLERFEQVFDPAAAARGAPLSTGDLALRAILTDSRGQVVDQLRIALSVPAASADAPGGARALRAAVDASAQNVAEWLSQQPELRAGGMSGR